MPKPTNTIGDRDYAKRLYVGRGGYSRKIKTVTDSAMDRSRRPKHSESKKPYMEDSYPDMEYSFDPWDPRFPPLDPGQPPEFPTNPGDPSMPPNLPWQDDPKAPHYFFGCDFLPPVFSPSHINSGEMASADLFFAPDESGVLSIEIDGPVSLLGETNPHRIFNIFKFRPAGGPYMLTVRAWEAGQIAADPRYRDMESAIPYQVTVKTAHYGMMNEVGQDFTVGVCTALGFVLRCEDPDPLEWDYATSAQTVARNSSATVAVLGGEGPYKWRIDGQGFTLQYIETTGLSNTVSADSTACGSAIITVTDKCGQKVTDGIRCSTSGRWVRLPGCAAPGAFTSADYSLPWTFGEYERVVGAYWCHRRLESMSLLGPTCDDVGDADPPRSCWNYCTVPYGNQWCHETLGCDQCVDISAHTSWTGQFPCAEDWLPNNAICLCNGDVYCNRWDCPE
jgi:hypothetical protein